MIQADLLRTYHERLLQEVQTHINPTTGMLHVTSDIHPHKASIEEIPIAENFALSLLWCQSKSMTAILQARMLMTRLLRWQRGGFPRYLHQLEESTNEGGSQRIALVMEALLRWHRVAIGDLAQPLEKALHILKQNLHFEASHVKDHFNVIYDHHDIMAILKAHFQLQILEHNLRNRLSLSVAPWSEPGWLERPWNRLGSVYSLLECIQLLQLGKLPEKIEISHLWSVLWHQEGTPLPEPVSQKRDFHLLSRNFEGATTRRGLPHACALHLMRPNHQKAWLFVEFAQLNVEPFEGGAYLHIQTDPQQEALALAHPLFRLVTQSPQRWSCAKRGMQAKAWSSLCANDLRENPIEHVGLGWKLQLKSPHSKGYFQQQAYRLESQEIEPTPRHCCFFYQPFEIGSSSITLLLQSCSLV